MRCRFLLVVFGAMLTQACGPQDADLRASEHPDSDRASHLWLYDAASPFHGVLPVAVQEMRLADPVAVASAVCAALGGQLDFMQPPRPDRERIGFNCAFFEPGLRTTTEFGELRRIHGSG